jgi:hypothetical protein
MLGEPLELTGWVCDQCHEKTKSERRRIGEGGADIKDSYDDEDDA